MTRTTRAVPLLATLMTAASAMVFGAGPAVAASAPASAEMLTPDPSIRMGVLPNGMHYQIKGNVTPKGQAALRLRIGSGSLQESDDQQGLAHFLEHMAFKGSTHVPANQMVKILQRKGLAFGPDTNAFTAWTQTVYMLDLPETDSDTLDTGLMLMRETAGELTISPETLEPERGVVLSEERVRDTPPYRAFKAKLTAQLDGQLAARRMPIGQVEIIKTAPASRLAAFYRANYRPERATLIVVGDFDPADMEARIRARFSDWQPVGPATVEPDLGVVKPRDAKTQLLVIPGASNEIELSWVRPLVRAPDSVERRRRDIIDQLALSVLNRRLEKLSRSDTPPFLTAGVGYDPIFKSARIASARAVTAPDRWREGVTALDQEVRRLARFGVLSSELQREIVDTRTSMVNDVASADTRRTPDLASEMVNAVDEEQVFDTPSAELSLFDDVTRDLSAETVSKAASTIFAGSGPLLQMNAPAPVEGGEAAVDAVFKASNAVEVLPPTTTATVTWPYARFGDHPGQVTRTTAIPDLGATQYAFANGVGLTVKQTSFKTDQVLVTVKIGHGRSVLPSDRAYPVWAGQALTLGGLRLIRQEDMEQALNGRTYDAAFNIGDDGYTLRGETKPADIDVQMQVLAAYATDAGWRPEAFERLRVAMSNALPQFEATASGILSRDSQFLLTGRDKRYQMPDRNTLPGVKPEDLRALLETPLKTGQMEITIIGDIRPDMAVKAVAETFGALANRPEPKVGATVPVHFPAPGDKPLTLLHKGRADQAIALVGWKTTDFYANTRLARASAVLQDVLENRLLDQVRVVEGSTYSPQGDSRPSEVYPDYGYMIDFVETPVARVDAFFTNISKITSQLRDAPPTADEMTRAVKPRIERILKSQQTNDYWLARLSGSIADPRRLDLIRTTLPEYQAVTAADVQAAAQKFLSEKAQWKLVIRADARSEVAAK